MRTRSQAEWCRIFEGSDACVAPVLSLMEATRHPHNEARATFVGQDGIVQPAPTPTFSRSATKLRSPPPRNSDDREAILREWGIDAS